MVVWLAVTYASSCCERLYMWAGASALLAAVTQQYPSEHTDLFGSQLWL